VLIKVFRGVFDPDVWQAGPARLETYESHVPLKIGGVLGAAARLEREMRSVMPGGPINEEYLAFVEDPVPSGVLNPLSRSHSPR